MVYLVIGVIIGIIAYVYFSNHKLASRLRFKVEKTQDSLADKVGNAIDDREQKIKTGQKSIDELKRNLIQVRTQINLTGKKAENYVAEAEKYNKIAKMAVDNNDDESARVALGKSQNAENQANAMQKALESAENIESSIIEQIRKLDSKVAEAEMTQSTYKAEYESLKIREKMQLSTAFGGVDNLDFDEEDSVLEEMRARVQAGGDVEKLTTGVDLSKYETGNVTIEEQLKKLKEA